LSRLLAGLIILVAACTGPVEGGTVPTRTSALPSSLRSTPPAGIVTCWAAEPPEGGNAPVFRDVTESSGLWEPLLGMRGHAAAWGEIDGNGWVDLFVGTFANRPRESYAVRGAEGPSPDRLLLGSETGFEPSPGFPEELGRTSGAAFLDLDLDGDLDLVVSRHSGRGDSTPSRILRNDQGSFHPVDDPGIPPDLAGRSVGALDFDGNGLPDLFIAEDRFSGGSSVLLRNLGQLRLEDATTTAGIPDDVHGLGVATADLSEDGLTDLFVAGSNRLFLANGDGTFREAPDVVPEWDTFGPEDDVSGASIADLNRDGRPDLVLGHHFNSTLSHARSVPIRVYLHRGLDAAGNPLFEDVTAAAGIPGLPTKAPHVEIEDVDNDGWPDIVTTASALNGQVPAVLLHSGLEGDVPRFTTPSGLGHPQYWVTGPMADVDRDGRLDILAVEWDPALPSLLLRNESQSGNWLSVEVGPELGGGLGARVGVYREGLLGRIDGLVGMSEISVSEGYASGQQTLAHFGLGDLAAVDVQIVLPGGETLDLPGLTANQHLGLPSGCS
jgi:hypothetical protein